MRSRWLQIHLWWFLLFFCATSYCQIIHETNVTVQTFAGSGVRAVIDGTGTQSAFYEIVSFNISPDGFLFAGQDNGTLRRIAPAGVVTSYQGPPYTYSVAASSSNRVLVSFNQNIYENIPALSLWNGGTRGYLDSSNFVSGAYGGILYLDFASDGTLWIADYENRRVRAIYPNGELRTLAGSGDTGFVDGNGVFTSFTVLYDISVGPLGDAAVTDFDRIRTISKEGIVRTVAGGEQGYLDGELSAARFGRHPGIFYAKNGDILVADRMNHAIRIIPGSTVTTVAGGNGPGFNEGTGETSQFNFPDDVVEDSEGNVYVADSMNYRIRKISFGAEPEPVPEADLNLRMYPGLEILGAVGRSYRIDVTPDLTAKTNWAPAAIITLTENSFVWFDKQNPGPPTKFYRAMLLP